MDAGPSTLTGLTFRPVTPDAWEDMQALFGAHRVLNTCWCMYWRLRRADFQRGPGEAHRLAMGAIVSAGRVPGILAYVDGRPIGWCAVAPRTEFPTLERSPTLKRVDDQPVWSIVCFFVAPPYRRRGVSKALLAAAMAHARDAGARIIEAYPLAPTNGANAPNTHYMGQMAVLAAAGFVVVAQRSPRRVIMRYSVPA